MKIIQIEEQKDKLTSKRVEEDGMRREIETKFLKERS